MKHLFLFSMVATASTLHAMEADSTLPLKLQHYKKVNLLDSTEPESEINIDPIPANCSSPHKVLFHIVAHSSSCNRANLEYAHFKFNKLITPISIVDKATNKYINHPNVIRHIIGSISGNKHQNILARALMLPGAKNYLYQSTCLYAFRNQLTSEQKSKYIDAGGDPLYNPSTPDDGYSSSIARTLPDRLNKSKNIPKTLMEPLQEEVNDVRVEVDRIDKPKNIQKTLMESLQKEVNDIRAEVDKDGQLRSAIMSEDENDIIASLSQANITSDEALGIAIQRNKAKSVSFLLELGADPKPHLQKRITNQIIFDLLCAALDYTQKVPEEKPIPYKLQKALESEDIHCINQIIKEEKITLFESLKAAIALNLEKTVLILLAAGADPDPHMQQQIHSAAIMNALCSALEFANTKVSQYTPEQSNELQFIFLDSNERQILDTLQRKNISLDTALKFAITIQNLNAILLLRALGAHQPSALKKLEPINTDRSESHPLIKENLKSAVEHKNLEKMKWLFQNGANPNTHLYDTVTMVMSNMVDNNKSSLQKDLDMIELMCNQGAYDQDLIDIVETMENMPTRLLASLKKGQALHKIFKK